MKKLTDLRPCDHCRGPLKGGLFYVVRFSVAHVTAQAMHEFLAMHQFFGGRASLALVENFAPSAATAVTVAMDEPEYRALMTELVICAECYVTPVCLAELAERRGAATTAAADEAQG